MIQIRLRLDESIHASQLAENYPYLESGSGGWKITLRTPPWRPPMDVYETEENLVVRMEIAGMSESEFQYRAGWTAALDSGHTHRDKRTQGLPPDGDPLR